MSNIFICKMNHRSVFSWNKTSYSISLRMDVRHYGLLLSCNLFLLLNGTEGAWGNENRLIVSKLNNVDFAWWRFIQRMEKHIGMATTTHGTAIVMGRLHLTSSGDSVNKLSVERVAEPTMVFTHFYTSGESVQFWSGRLQWIVIWLF